ncbi:hypothetical protein ACQ4PT_062080 [Festuca glaucescens]
MNRGFGRPPGRGADGRGRQFPSGANGRGGGRYSGPNSFTRQRNFVQGESSGSSAWDDQAGARYQDGNGDAGGFGNAGGLGSGGFGSFHRGSGYGFNNRRFNNQYHRQGTYQPRNQSSSGNFGGGNARNNVGVDGGRREGGIDQDLLQQTVQSVVAAITAASQKGGGQPGGSTSLDGNVQAPPPSVSQPDAVAMYGYANEALMFFEIPFRVEVDSAIRENFQWEVTHFHNNVYKVKFPNKNEVQRMKKFRTYPVPNRETDMEFDEWSAMEEPTFMLPEVWLRVTGIPSDVRNDYIALWAIGSLFGKTMEVDMAFTRKTKILRLRIGCMDASLIPDTSNVYISRGFFV